MSKQLSGPEVSRSSFPVSLQISPLVKVGFIARSLTKVGYASMNQALMVLATKSYSLLFDLYPRIFVKQALMVVAIKSCSNPLPIEFL